MQNPAGFRTVFTGSTGINLKQQNRTDHLLQKPDNFICYRQRIWTTHLDDGAEIRHHPLMLSVLITIVGLLVLEIVQSVDNAIVNAHMLKTMSERARKWFLVWGILTAVFLVRGLLPLLIVWITAPGITLWQAVLATFGSDDEFWLAAVLRPRPLGLF